MKKCHGNTKKRRFPAYFQFYRSVKKEFSENGFRQTDGYNSTQLQTKNQEKLIIKF